MADPTDKATRLEGRVVVKRINPGSKSDHEAAVLVCARGEFKLRRKGGPPFGDAELERLAGKRIRGVGLVSAGQFIVDSYEVVPGDGAT
ncbi:MAG: hypothetical protein K8R60_19915 [Burkholderiales bacterium]|nr:hypothetical protein [Burkholderiales bacterium]